jgi:hypothetical protein
LFLRGLFAAKAGTQKLIRKMKIEDEFRKHAERCRIMAEASDKADDRAFWLLLAQSWQMLAQDMEAEPPEERAQTKGKLARS